MRDILREGRQQKHIDNSINEGMETHCEKGDRGGGRDILREGR